MYNLKFSEPKKVDTVRGPRMLSVAIPTPEFWEAWKKDKEAIKSNDISVSKNTNTNSWEVAKWEEINKEEREAKKVASKSTDAEIDIPCPEGLEYLPYQKAGIAFVLRIFGEID